MLFTLPLLDVIGGCVSKAQNAGKGNWNIHASVNSTPRHVGDLHEYRGFDVVWLFGLTRRPARYTNQKIWSRRNLALPVMALRLQNSLRLQTCDPNDLNAIKSYSYRFCSHTTWHRSADCRGKGRDQ
jgi:hypothetical protein